MSPAYAVLAVLSSVLVGTVGCASIDDPNATLDSTAEGHLEAEPEAVSFAAHRWTVAVSFGAAGGEEGICSDAPPAGLVCWFESGSTHAQGRLLVATLQMKSDGPEVRLYQTTDDGKTMTGGAPLAITTHPTTASDLTARVTRDELGAIERVSVSATSPFGVYFSRED